MFLSETHKLETTADGRLNIGTTKGGNLPKLSGYLDGVVEQEAQATLVTETGSTGNLSKQDWRGPGRSCRFLVESWWKTPNWIQMCCNFTQSTLNRNTYIYIYLPGELCRAR